MARCVICQKTFEPKSAKQKCCSHDCNEKRLAFHRSPTRFDDLRRNNQSK